MALARNNGGDARLGEDIFDADHLRLWGELFTPEPDAQQADGIWQLLHLRAGCRLLDAPCGYGRLSVQFGFWDTDFSTKTSALA